MISKKLLQSFIQKYYLGGLNNQAKWRIKDNTLTVYAGEMGKVCKIFLKKFDFEDAELGIFDTDKLNKLINITSGNLLITPNKTKAIYNKLKISDETFDLMFSLADILVLKKVSYPVENDKTNFEIEIELNEEIINNFIKAKNSISDQSNMVVSTSYDKNRGMLCDFIFGDVAKYANKVSYKIEGKINTDELISLPFNSDIFKEILSSNKDMSEGKIKISSLGLMKINFFSEEIESEYYLIRSE